MHCTEPIGRRDRAVSICDEQQKWEKPTDNYFNWHQTFLSNGRRGEMWVKPTNTDKWAPFMHAHLNESIIWILNMRRDNIKFGNYVKMPESEPKNANVSSNVLSLGRVKIDLDLHQSSQFSNLPFEISRRLLWLSASTFAVRERERKVRIANANIALCKMLFNAQMRLGIQCAEIYLESQEINSHEFKYLPLNFKYTYWWLIKHSQFTRNAFLMNRAAHWLQTSISMIPYFSAHIRTSFLGTICSCDTHLSEHLSNNGHKLFQDIAGNRHIRLFERHICSSFQIRYFLLSNFCSHADIR